MKKFLVLMVCLFALCLLLGTSLALSRYYFENKGLIEDGAVQGFDIDKEGNLYIGYINCINVYRDGALIRKLDPPTSRGYYFCVENDELAIRVDTSSVKIYSLDGELLRECTQRDYDVKAHSSEKTFANNTITRYGKEYRMQSYLGFKPFEIQCDGVAIYTETEHNHFYYGGPFFLLFSLTVVIGVISGLVVMSDEKVKKAFR